MISIKNRQPQRSYSLEDALIMAATEARCNNIELTLKPLYSKGDVNNELMTSLCYANNARTNISSLGGGSGHQILSQVKATYDALKQSLCYQACLQDPSFIRLFSTRTSPSTDFLLSHSLMPSLLMSDAYLNHEYPWISLKQYNNPTEVQYYPLGLFYANIFHDDIINVTHDTGLAIGATRHEAIIHGLNRWVDSDAASLFLLKTIMKENAEKIRIVKKSTLPDDLMHMVMMIEKKANDPLFIIDTTSDIQIPSFLVTFNNTTLRFQPQGSASSPSKHLALKQALHEIVQYLDRYNTCAAQFREGLFSFYADYPLIIKAMECNLSEHIENNHVTHINYADIVDNVLHDDLTMQIELMISLLSKKGAHVYTSLIFEGDTGIAVTYTLVTSLECFSLIRDGRYYPLKQRGVLALQ